MEDLGREVENRTRVFDAVCKYQGLHLREISRTTGLSVNLVDYHLRHLEKRELVFSVQEGQFKRYFPKDRLGAGERKDIFCAPDKRLVGLLRQRIPFRIVVLLSKHDMRTHKELVEWLRRSPSTVSHHLEKLVVAGVVEEIPYGKGYRLANPAHTEMLLSYLVPHPSTLEEGFLEIWKDLHI